MYIMTDWLMNLFIYISKLKSNQVGRVTAFQTKLPDIGEGSLKSREDPNKRAADVRNYWHLVFIVVPLSWDFLFI